MSSPLLALFLRECYGYLATPVAYLFLLAFWVLSGLFAFELGGLFERNQADLDPLFTYLPWLDLVLIPALTMRLWAEEWRQGTIELLLTLPISLRGAILAKFLAAWAFLALGLIGTFPLWFTVNWLGEPDNGAILAAYLGGLLMGGGYLTLGLLASVLTRSQIVAFLLAALLSFLFTVSGTPLLLDPIADHAPTWLLDALQGLSFQTHFHEIARGVLVVGDLLFFLVVVAGGLELTRLLLEWRKGDRAATGRLLSLPILIPLLALLLGQLSSFRLDLTEDRRYSLSPGTEKLLAELKAPIEIRLYFSDEATRDMPFLRADFQRVREFLELYPRESARVTLKVIKLSPYSEEEEEAVALGLRPVQLAPDAPEVLFGIAVLRGERRAVIPFLDREREPFLEYDLAELIHEVARERRPKIALYADPDLLIRGGIDPFTKKFRPPWIAVENLFRFYDVSMLPEGFSEIGEADLLLLIHPQELPEQSLEAIARYLEGGGAALVFVDPYAERDGPPRFVDPKRKKASDLAPIFRKLGFELVAGKFVADDRYAVRVKIGQGKPVRHLAFLGLEGEALGDHPVVSRLKKLYLSSAGAFRKLDPKLNWQVLLASSERSMLMPTVALDYLFNPVILQEAFRPEGRRSPMAVFVERKGALIAVADTDLLRNRLWTNPAGSGFLPFADNGSFVINAVDLLTGDPALIEVRGRRKLLRPFRVVEEMRERAQRRFEAKLEELRRLLQETEERLEALKTKKEASEEEKKELRALEARQRELRRELKRLGYRLEEEIAALAERLKLLNIAAAPLLQTLLLLLLGRLWVRRWTL